MKLLFSFLLPFFIVACQTTSPVANINQSLTKSFVSDIEYEEYDENEENEYYEEGLTHLIKDKSSLIIEPNVINEVKYKNIWLKLAEGFTFEVPENSRIAKQRDYYLRHPNYLKKVSKRAEPFLHLIVEQIEAKKLPLELALLPVVESTFDPFAYSSAKASGLWQFMPVTGERFGLQQNWWYDGRRDVYASTQAALRYMDILHGYLGNDWLRAFAAYNSGEGRVKRAIKKNKKNNKPLDYWHLSLPKETQEYVPKLLALIDILRNHKKYNIELPFIENEQVLTHVDTGTQLDLSYVAKLSNLTLAEVQLLNPAFNHWATSPKGPHKLLIPTVIASQFTKNLSQMDKADRVRWIRYKVRSGDYLSRIAKNNGTTTSVLKQINDINDSFLQIGQLILIPLASEIQQDYLYTQAKHFEYQNSQSKRKIIHTIVEGNTLWDISRLYKVTSKEIAKWNNISIQQTLRLGHKLSIWKLASSAQIEQITYQVRAGDSLGMIAQKYNVKTADLVRWNQLQQHKYIKPGQKLLLHIEVKKSRG